MDLLPRVRTYIEERDLLQPGDGLVLGVSGGPDSLCLLDLCSRLAPEWNLTVHVAHLNHGLRPEAASEAEFVRAEAAKHGLRFHFDKVDTCAHAAERRHSIEEAARDLRYAFLARTAQAVGARVIAVAHTADDQAETVLMHFLRGTGLAGLRGMLPKSQVPSPVFRVEVRPPNSGLGTLDTGPLLIRPLLSFTRAEVETYCAEHGLHPVQDATNLDMTFFRNRLRHELLPQLESYNPNIRAVLTRLAEVAAGEYDILHERIGELWQNLARAEAGHVTFDREKWLALTLSEQRALLRAAVAHLRPDLRDIDFTPIARAAQFTHHAGPGRSCDVLGGLCLSISLEGVTLGHWDAPLRLPDHVPLLDASGQLPPDWEFRMETLERGAWSFAEIESQSSEWRVWVDADRLPLHHATGEGGGRGLTLRARLPGERFHPLGMGGHSVKVSDFMVNAKVEEPLRDRWPLVVCGDAIVWVVGLRLDERYKVTSETQTILRLEFAKFDPRHLTTGD